MQSINMITWVVKENKYQEKIDDYVVVDYDNDDYFC